MNTENFSEKEIMIFNGVIKLMNEGSNFHTMKASDIAAAANIGKGTLYNYFKSKEEIIGKTIIYMMITQFQYFIKLVDSVETFKEKFYIGFKMIEESAKTQDNTFQFFLSSFGQEELKQFFKEGMQIFEERKQFVKMRILELAKLGYKEGIIAKPEDTEYTYFVFMSCLMGFSHNFCQGAVLSDEKINKAKEDSYKLLLKGLN
ncbi:MAG: TetR/AcrR family transcriptional regulator [Clostridium sp.]